MFAWTSCCLVLVIRKVRLVLLLLSTRNHISSKLRHGIIPSSSKSKTCNLHNVLIKHYWFCSLNMKRDSSKRTKMQQNRFFSMFNVIFCCIFFAFGPWIWACWAKGAKKVQRIMVHTIFANPFSSKVSVPFNVLIDRSEIPKGFSMKLPRFFSLPRYFYSPKLQKPPIDDCCHLYLNSLFSTSRPLTSSINQNFCTSKNETGKITTHCFSTDIWTLIGQNSRKMSWHNFFSNFNFSFPTLECPPSSFWSTALKFFLHCKRLIFVFVFHLVP